MSDPLTPRALELRINPEDLPPVNLEASLEFASKMEALRAKLGPRVGDTG